MAIKKFKESEEDEIVKKTTMREVKILKMLKHPNVVELKEAFRKKGIVYLVFEYVQNNLLEVLEKSPDGLDPELIRLLLYQLLKGLAYMHSLQMVHRDIKPENLLISDKKELKICDFGFARLLRRPAAEEELTDYVATRWYRPPELLVGATYGKEIDLWAVGCIFGELIDGNPMFPGENELDQLFLIQKCLGPLTPDHYETFLKNPRFLGMKFPEINNLETIDKRYLGKLAPKAMNFLKGLLRMAPADRLTAVDALKHPYFDGLREEDFLRKLSSNNYIKNESKLGGAMRDEEPKTVNHDRKKYSNNFYNPPSNERERTEEALTAGEFNRTTKINAPRKPKEDIARLLNSKGFNGNLHSKSVNKASKPTQKQLKEKNISLEKHQNREIITKTQAGFYINGGGAIQEREEESSNPHATHYSRNKIYNVEQPKSRNHQRTKNMPTNTEEIAEEDEMWQSTGQLPLIMVGSQQHKGEKLPKGHGATNIIITNSTFNYRSNH